MFDFVDEAAQRQQLPLPVCPLPCVVGALEERQVLFGVELNDAAACLTSAVAFVA